MEKTLEDKVGQILMAGFDGLNAPEYFLEWLREGRLGGVILFARNVESPQQLAALTGQLHEAAKYPLLIAIDQEGGTVARLREGFSESPGALALASIRDNREAVVEEVSFVLATEMKTLGINWTYAPVVDVHYNSKNPTMGTRSFGADPEDIATLAAAAVRGFQKGGVAASAKHFLGLGNTPIDTHLALPTLDTSIEQLRSIDLLPYRVALDNQLATIMTTHTIFSALDNEYPATLSPIIIQQLIRDELGFAGVVTTDCMEMKAIDDNFAITDSVVAAALAGVDIILFSHTADKQAEAYEHLLAAVQSGKVPLELVEQANARIDALKTRFPAGEPNLDRVYTPEHQQIMQTAARASISQPRSEAGVLPIKADDSHRILFVEFAPGVDSPVQETTSSSHLGYYIRQRFPDAEIIVMPTIPSQDDVAPILEQRADILILATRNAHLIPAQEQAVKTLSQHPATTILLALRNPYDAQLIESGTVLCSAADSRPSLEAITAALAGDFVPTGRVHDAIRH
ncbi:MAG: beta-N-acetylhexosaminidase [Chloroflexi bacterium]|nr:beta-N-acetylhexosaminidase [Chloroflexota bacterium]